MGEGDSRVEQDRVSVKGNSREENALVIIGSHYYDSSITVK